MVTNNYFCMVTIDMTNKYFNCEELLEKLVIEVEKYPALWDQSKTSYRMRDVKYNAWCKIAEACGCANGKKLVFNIVIKLLNF